MDEILIVIILFNDFDSHWFNVKLEKYKNRSIFQIIKDCLKYKDLPDTIPVEIHYEKKNDIDGNKTPEELNIKHKEAIFVHINS